MLDRKSGNIDTSPLRYFLRIFQTCLSNFRNLDRCNSFSALRYVLFSSGSVFRVPQLQADKRPETCPHTLRCQQSVLTVLLPLLLSSFFLHLAPFYYSSDLPPSIFAPQFGQWLYTLVLPVVVSSSHHLHSEHSNKDG